MSLDAKLVPALKRYGFMPHLPDFKKISIRGLLSVTYKYIGSGSIMDTLDSYAV